MDGISPSQFQRAHMNDLSIVENGLTFNDLLYDIDILDGNLIVELARRKVQKYQITVRLLIYKNPYMFCEQNKCSLSTFSLF